MNKKKNIFAYNMLGVKSSGARFYRSLSLEINCSSEASFQDSKAVLFNIYTPVRKLIVARLFGKKVFLRVDGLWNDKLNKYFLENMNWFWRPIFGLLGKIPAASVPLNHLANLIFDNYKAFIKIFIANGLVYQSQFSRTLHEVYIRKKHATVILNGAPWIGGLLSRSEFPRFERELRFCIIYSNAPLKGVYESVKFVGWLNNVKNIRAKLIVIGFDWIAPPNSPDDFLESMQGNAHVELLDAFDEFGDLQKRAIQSSHFYLCLSRADNCPNALVEAMSYGLPVLGLRSGGVSEIVGSAGVLLPFDDFDNGFFCGSRYEFLIMTVPFDELFDGLKKLIENYEFYLDQVAERFSSDLDIKIVSQRYRQFLENFLS